jgi:hypothetical protein
MLMASREEWEKEYGAIEAFWPVEIGMMNAKVTEKSSINSKSTCCCM